MTFAELLLEILSCFDQQDRCVDPSLLVPSLTSACQPPKKNDYHPKLCLFSVEAQWRLGPGEGCIGRSSSRKGHHR